jgi:hypothetical protein
MQPRRPSGSRSAILAARLPRWPLLLRATLAVFACLAAFLGLWALIGQRDAATAAGAARSVGGRAERGEACVPRWRVVAHGVQVPDLYDVSALSATDVWAVGSRGGFERGSIPVAVHWDGHVLRTTKPFTPSSRHGELNAVVAVSHDSVWAGGIDGWGLGRPVVVHWDGNRWTKVPTPPLRFEGALSDIAEFGADDVWAVGQLGTYDDPAQPPLLMRWNGHVWRIIEMSEVAPRGSGLNAIDGTSAGDVWAVGGQNLRGELYGYERFILHWDGQAWTKPAIYPDRAFEGTVGAIDVASKNDVWMVNGASSEQSSDMVVHWRRLGGSRVAYSTSRNRGLNDVAAISQKNVWVVGYRYGDNYDHSRPMLLRWNGRSWRIQRAAALDRLNVILGSLSAVSAQEIWAAGGGPVSSSGRLGKGLLARYSC